MTGVIDIHSHIYPRWYIELLKQRTEIPRVTGEEGDERFAIFPSETAASGDAPKPAGGRPMTDDYWSIGTKLAFMDRFGIERTVLSLGNPWLDPLPAAQGLEVARQANGEFAALEAETGGRILGMGVLPPGDPADAVAVAGEIAESASLYAAVTGTRPCGMAFDDDRLEPLWAELARSGLPLLIHPHYSTAMDDLAGLGHGGPVAIGFPVETTIAVVRLVVAGVLERHPGLRLIASHGGGTLPFLAGRLDAGWRSDPSWQRRLSHPPSEDLMKVFLDAVVYHERALWATADLVGTGSMAFGTDHPFSVADPQRNLQAIDVAFEGREREDVRWRSAVDLLGLPPMSAAGDT
jgi:aminocarboxymuconate-semialdehyde decarboxylase